MSKYYDKLVEIDESLTKEMKEHGLTCESDGQKKEILGNNRELKGENVDPKSDEDDLVVTEDGDETIEIPKDSLTDDQKKDILADKGVDKKTVDNLKDTEEIDGALDATLNNDEVKKESGAVDLADMDWDGPAILKYANPNTPERGGFYVTDEEWSSDIQRATEFDSKEAAQDKLDELVDKKGMDGKYLYIWSAKMKFDEGTDVSEEVVLRMDDDDLDMHGFVKGRDGKELELTDNEEEAEKFQHEELGKSKIEAICAKFHYDPSTFKTVSLDPRADEPYEDDNEVAIDDTETWVSLDPTNPSATTLA